MKLTRRKLAFAAVLLIVSGIPLTSFFFNSPYRIFDVRVKIDALEFQTNPTDPTLNKAIDELSEQIRRYPRVTEFRIEWEYSASDTPDGLWRFALHYNRKMRTVTTLQEGSDRNMYVIGSIRSVTDGIIFSWAKAKNKIPKILILH